MHWADDFVGLPYENEGRGPEAFDCLGLLIAVNRDVFGKEIEDPGFSMAQALRPSNRKKLEHQFERAETPTEGDALLFNLGRRALHVGVYINENLMLHSHFDLSTVERWSGPNWFCRFVGAYRLV